MTKRIGIVGLRISQLTGNPQETLMGNPVRSWALFQGLGRYGFETELFVEGKADVDPSLEASYGDRLVRRRQQFLDKARNGHYDAVVICGTRIHTTLEQQEWLSDLSGAPVFLAQCYHNVADPLPSPLVDQIAGATFVTPRYVKRWSEDFPGTRTGIMTTGEVSRPANATEANGDAVFVGHIHSHAIIKKIAQVAQRDSARNFHIVTSRIKQPEAGSQDYIAFGQMADDAERQEAFTTMLKQVGVEQSDNFKYHFLPPGHEEDLMNKVSVGMDFSWNPNWLIDNSKVPNYLSYGLNVVSQLPAPSYRFVHKFDAGAVLAHDADGYAWQDAIQQAAELSLDRKNELRREAGAYFSWNNAVFDLASILLDYYDQHD